MFVYKVHNNLDGTIPMELSSLSDLHTLVLGKNFEIEKYCRRFIEHKTCFH